MGNPKKVTGPETNLWPKWREQQKLLNLNHSSCHATMADDALDVDYMNVKRGGKQ